MTPVTASQLLMLVVILVVLMAVVVVVSRPGACLPDSADLLLVAAGDLQDVQVDVDEHGEHREEARAVQHDDAPSMDDGEEGTKAVVALRLQLPDHDCVAEDMGYFTYEATTTYKPMIKRSRRTKMQLNI